MHLRWYCIFNNYYDVASVMTHRKHGAVDFNLLKTFGSFVGIGVIFGTLLASFLNTKTLVLLFQLLCIFGAIYY